MKTIEEKAKAYDEIIERAKTMLSAGEVMYGKENNASQLITDLIPELAGSEDEKIRKFIVETVFREYGDSQEYLDVIAYLEKQKEQKPIIKGWVARDKALQLNFYTNKPKRGKTHWIENGGDSVQIMPDTEHLYEEQNFDTLDWKDEPIEVELVVRASTEKRQEHVPENEETGTRQEQKSAEWSDKDKNIFNLALNLIKHSDDCDGILDKELAVKWFAELPSRFVPQPKQEWSDGNKQWFDAIIKDYEDLLSGDEDHDPAIQIKINLLKSLRPSWKPSKEQVDAFEESLMSVAYTENKIILESLLEQLKKLCQ